MTVLDADIDADVGAAPVAADDEQTPRHDRGPIGMQRIRIGLLTVIACMIGAAAGEVFDQWRWSLVAAPAVPGAVALLDVRARSAIRIALGAVAVVVAVGGVVTVEGGDLGDVVDAFTAGLQRLLSTEWPSPTRPDLVGTVAAVVAAAAAVAAELATRRRWHLLPLVPPALAYVVVIGASAPAGAQIGWVFPIAVTAAIFAALRPDDTIEDRFAILRGERRILVLIAIAIGLAALVSIPVGFTERTDPRDDDPPTTSSPLLDPIEATLALRDLDPAIILHVVEAAPGEVVPARWRTAALEDYDGQRWTPALSLLPIGRTLGAAEGQTLDAEVTFLDASLRLVPLPGAPIAVDADVETDPDRTVVRLAEPVSAPEAIAIRSGLPPIRGDAIEIGVGARPIDDESSAFTELAESLGGGGPVIEQLFTIESTMRDEFVLDNDVQGGGLQRALVELFLRDTRRGTSEQFATGFVLLARSLGVDARVATGFDAGSTEVARLELSSSDAAVWPEVRLADGRWLALDPVPERESTGDSPPLLGPESQTPPAPQPPIAPPRDSDGENLNDDDVASDDENDPLSTAVGLVLRGGAILAGLLLPVLLVAATIVSAKWWRRRRRLRAGTATERIRGAWAVATDELVDGGLDIAPSSTDREIARAGRPIVGPAGRDLDRLAELSSAATFGRPARADLLADDASACLEAIERGIGTDQGRWQQLRRQLSVRSLRSATRSPVSV